MTELAIPFKTREILRSLNHTLPENLGAENICSGLKTVFLNCILFSQLDGKVKVRIINS
jgi:hypothetical protein